MLHKLRSCDWHDRLEHQLHCDTAATSKSLHNWSLKSPRNTDRDLFDKELMQPSIFNLRVPIAGKDDVFLMNTLTDAQLLVSSDVAALLDRHDFDNLNDTERGAFDLLNENGFFVSSHEADRKALDSYFHSVKHGTLGSPYHGPDHAAVQLRLRLLLPGRSRRLQSVRRQDDARDLGAGRAAGSKTSSIGCGPKRSR